MRRVSTVLAAVFFASASIGAQPGTQPRPTEPATKVADVPAEPTITLREQGQQEGRRELRLRPKADTTEQVSMTMKVSMEMTMNGVSTPKTDIPTIELAAEAHIESVESNGDIKASMKFSDSKIVKDDATPQAVVAAMESSLKDLKLVTVDMVYSDRGVYRSGKVNAEKAQTQTRVMFESMSESMQLMCVPFPKEAVGVGAKWEVVSKPTMNGITQTMTATYTVTALTQESVSLEVAVKQSATEQKMQNPSLPPDATVIIKSLSGSGTGKSEVAFARSLPTQASVKTTANVDMSMKMNEQETTMKQTMTMDMTLKGKPVNGKK